MMRMNASQAEKAHNIPRRTVGRWITSGKLPADEGGYFEEANFLILNATRLTRPASGRKTSIAPTKIKPNNETKKSSDLKPDEPAISTAAANRQKVDLRKALANAEKAEIEVKIKMKDLISRELVSRVFRQLYGIDSTEWRGLGARLAPDIMAICEIEDPAKEAAVGDSLEQEVFDTLNHVKQAINNFLDEIESDERITDE